MGAAGRKAKQTKVARELKYFSPNTDFSSLERELHSTSHAPDHWSPGTDEVGEDDEDDFGRWASGER